MWVREAKEAVKIPVFASLNAVNRDTWLEYAGLLEETGVDGLEVDILASPEDSGTAPGTIENDQFELVAELKRTVSIPVSVKLGSSYTDVLHMIRLMDRAGADAFVLFNRPFVPDIDLHELKVTSPMAFSDATDARPALRCVALLEGNINADVCCGTGVADGEQAVKMILAGATAVQVVSALYRYGVPHIRAMLAAMDKWMETNRYARLTDFRGMLSRRHVPDPWAYTRNQYVKILMNTDRIIRNAPVI
jgi:dihydroorotate dehydrogenase (fumarate)